MSQATSTSEGKIISRTFDAHRAVAALVFVAAFIVYANTMAVSVSFWDCGEFATVSTIMGVPHPPGVPTFVMVMRIFSMLPLAADMAVRCTYMNVLAGALTILLTYLISVRVIRMMRGREQTMADKIAVLGGSAIGALSLAWSYSMWFNSVESIVWTPGLFCTALNVWLALVWHEKADEPDHARYLILIAYTVGLSIGVHLFSALAVPVVVLIVHFRRNPLQFGSFMRIIAIGAVTTFALYPVTIKYLPKTAESIGILAPVLIIAAACLLLWWAVTNKRTVLRFGVTVFLAVLLGYSTFGSVFIRAGLHPKVDENDPSSAARFFSYVNREQYGSRPILPRIWNHDPAYHSTWDFFARYQIDKMYLRYLWWQFIGRTGAPDLEYQDAGVTPNYTPLKFIANNPAGILRLLAVLTCVPFMLGLVGMGSQFMRDKRGWLIVSALFFMLGLAIVLYLNQDDPQPRDRDYSYVGSFLAFAVWIGIGAAAVIEWLSKRYKASAILCSAAAALLLLLSPVTLLARNWRMNDRTGNHVAFDYSYNMLESCAPNAVLITNGDNDTFPVWYMQEVEHVRPDVRIVNLSLANTGWYIKQMRDWEPRVPISFSDPFIDRYLDRNDEEALIERYWPPDKQKIELNTPDGKMVWNMPATEYIPIGGQAASRANNFLRVQDMLVLDILRTDYDPAKTHEPKPIFFATTVPNSNMIGLRDYLTEEGLVMRVNPRGHETIDPNKCREDLLVKFKDHFRGLADPRVHLDDNAERILQNYRTAFVQLAYFYLTQPDSGTSAAVESESLEHRLANFDRLSNHQKALAMLDDMEHLIPERVRPMESADFSVEIGRMYWDLGRPEELRSRLEAATKSGDQTIESASRIAALWVIAFHESTRAEALLQRTLGDNPTADDELEAARGLYTGGAYALAARNFEHVLSSDPDNGTAVGGLIEACVMTGDRAKAMEVLEQWVARHPNDTNAKKRLEDMRKQATSLNQASSLSPAQVH